MKRYVAKRVMEIADFVIENNCTVRCAAKRFGVSKSTAHKDLQQRLKLLDVVKAEKAEKILQNNMRQRHLRGGAATRRKYLALKKM